MFFVGAADKVRLLLDDVEVVPVADPHGQDGEVLHADGQQRRQDDLRNDEEKAQPRISEKIFNFSSHLFLGNERLVI